jgi:hypothetical protein
MKIGNLAKEIFAKEFVDPKTVSFDTPDGVPQTSISKEKIDDVLDIAKFVREKATNILSEVDLAIKDLSGESKPSVLESQDDFKTLVLRLEKMKRKIAVI